jgi:uncharacterized protein YjbI with pentapeptide repeats
MKRLELLRWLVLALLLVGAVVTSLVAVLNGESLSGLLLNVGSEMAGAVLTYALFELVIARREGQGTEKAELIAQMDSNVRDVAVAAVEKLRRCGWLTDGSLHGSSFWSADLAGADLSNADLRKVKFDYPNLENANFRFANMQGTRLSVANLQEAFFFRTDLRGAHLGNSDLKSANLTWANLEGADLGETLLQGADLGQANLQDADLIYATWSKLTVLPDGTLWTPDTDMARFTDPDHPDFWRSDDPHSPAY